MKVAVVHDWLITYAGAERVLQSILNIFPQADLFTLIDFLPEHDRVFLQQKNITPSFLQKWPQVKKWYRYYLPFFPIAIETFNLCSYDLVISNHHCAAKGVITGPRQLHVCFCQTPARYAWDLQYQYQKETKKWFRLLHGIQHYFLHKFRLWDACTANRVDYFIANSQHIARRINKIYRRDATVIYPCVNTHHFPLKTSKSNFYLTASRMVAYKNIDKITQAFAKMPDKELIVIGDGPHLKKIQSKASKNIKFLGFQPTSVLSTYMAKAKAFIFAAEEDFGIVVVEAQSCGTPVIAYGKGGALETVIPGKTGCFFLRANKPCYMLCRRKF